METEYRIKTEVQALLVSLHLHQEAHEARIVPTSVPQLFKLQIILIGNGVCLNGLAFMVNDYEARVFLDASALYGVLYGQLQTLLKQYTVDHPWIVGV